MPRPTYFIGLLGLLAAAGCSSSSSAGGTKDAGIVDSCAPLDSSYCGQPCQMGNELGVGEFCNSSSDCHGPMARLCASLGDPGLHFCTMTCRPPSEGGVPEGGVPEGGMLEGGVAEGGLPEGGPTCGTGATCKCQGAECGCIPNTCL